MQGPCTIWDRQTGYDPPTTVFNNGIASACLDDIELSTETLPHDAMFIARVDLFISNTQAAKYLLDV